MAGRISGLVAEPTARRRLTKPGRDNCRTVVRCHRNAPVAIEGRPAGVFVPLKFAGVSSNLVRLAGCDIEVRQVEPG
jgi:hypothetical protein